MYEVIIPEHCGKQESLFDWGDWGVWFWCLECTDPETLIPIEETKKVEF